MQRLATPPRPDWRSHVERDLGFVFHTSDGAPYWDETCCYSFTAEEVDTLEAATGELEQMCLELVDRVVKAGDAAYDRLLIPRPAWEAIEHSWKAGEKNLYGRFDLRFDGNGPPRLLEYNADTPTALFEAAVVQWDWLEAMQPGSDQFNSIHEKLIDAWKHFGLGRTRVYFSAVKDDERTAARSTIFAIPRSRRASTPRASRSKTSAGTEDASSTSTTRRSKRCSSSIPGNGSSARSSASISCPARRG